MDQPVHAPVVDNDADPIANDSPNPRFADVLDARYGRRSVLKGGLRLAITSVLATHTAEAYDSPPAYGRGGKGGRIELGFAAVPVSRADTITLPAGYDWEPFIPWGTPITGTYPEYRDGGLNTGAEQEQQVGMHHDGMHYFPLGRGERGSEHGLLCVNHEYVDQPIMHPTGATIVSGRRTVPDEVRKEIAAHGVSVVEIEQGRNGSWRVVERSRYNRRITGGTPMKITGPARGHAKLATRYSPRGTWTRGTLNNCGHGYTPWGTYLTCEENWAGYFANKNPSRPREQARYGVGANSRYQWETVAGDAYERFDVTPKDGLTATEDYRNEVNGFGWIVEIDPTDPNSVPKKRTALGRFAHEGAWVAPPRAGRPVVFYMGDDSQNEYVYKFVTKKRWNPARHDDDMLDEGTLYVARFDADGSGAWLPLDFDDPDFIAAANARGVVFDGQGDVLLNTRLAADCVGATKMDRPEWGAVHPKTGEVYMTMTNNSSRTVIDAANPRGPNPYGHIIRWRESGNRHDATTFEWDIFVFGGPEAPDARGQSGSIYGTNGTMRELTADNILASPDGLWIDQFGLCWIQTDMSGSQLTAGPFGNNSMLVAKPETGEMKRFFVGPVGCEVTGVVSTPDGGTLFVNIQHPGEQGPSTWPSGGRARSATVIVTKRGGGIVGT